jgi:hypothetical protein
MKLTTLENLKLDLGIEGTDEDAFLDRAILIASAQVASVVGYEIEREARTIRLHSVEAAAFVMVDALPLHAVTKVTVEGEVWLDDDFRIDAGTGFAFTPWGVIRAPYGKAFVGEIEIKLESGYILDDPDRDLPLAFESAVAEIVKLRRFAKDRDPSVQSESVPGVHSVTYIQGNTDTVPKSAFDLLDPYRSPRIA